MTILKWARYPSVWFGHGHFVKHWTFHCRHCFQGPRIVRCPHDHTNGTSAHHWTAKKIAELIFKYLCFGLLYIHFSIDLLYYSFSVSRTKKMFQIKTSSKRISTYKRESEFFENFLGTFWELFGNFWESSRNSDRKKTKTHQGGDAQLRAGARVDFGPVS